MPTALAAAPLLPPCGPLVHAQAQLPAGMQLLGTPQDLEIYKEDGSRSENMGKLLRGVEWYIAVQQVRRAAWQRRCASACLSPCALGRGARAYLDSLTSGS